ncbi:hypothetical protein CLV59_106427 [Chitinophaga dinghuensis]|uniref:WWE domain-containing protein n=1 Tax=Chitinophaga dinghuensis TaxID=1539050 RepID=A0A327VV54_9BACT|nr:hypothetical protein [Chitinophaga dinghuensis]RAJ79362.1 hypothetical protein CLV59_106427 [Chitinophaga dinghuensis]
MKKVLNLMIAALPLMTVGFSELQAAPANRISSHIMMRDWMKSTNGTWPGMKDGKTYWYKLDKHGGLWWSTDGQKWEAVKDGAWADKDGKWLKIHDKKLVWSTDGKTWSEVPDWKWEASDGKWYKFDSNWGLWVNS